MGTVSTFLATRTHPLAVKSLAGNAIFRRSGALLGLVTALIGAPANTASAQGFFDLFGPRQAPPSQALGYASAPQTSQPALQTPRVSTPQRSAGGQSYCVRLCDGRHFPIQHNANAGPAQLCNSLCPAAETKVFSGSEIGRSTARDGNRYSSLQNAFAYRTRIVSSCTCNGKDSFGTATIDASADPTLRKGDIVATTDTQVPPSNS
jgi:hypothetical protein